MSEHTPGPWKMGVHGYTEPTSHRIYGPNDQVVADTEYSQQGLDDALLIIAAPDLLAATVLARSHIEHRGWCRVWGRVDPKCNCPNGPIIDQFEDAIAKAKPPIDTPARHEPGGDGE